jgi:hypothetical protein
MRTMPLPHSCATSSSKPTARQPAARCRHVAPQCNAILLATSLLGAAPFCAAIARSNLGPAHSGPLHPLLTTSLAQAAAV